MSPLNDDWMKYEKPPIKVSENMEEYQAYENGRRKSHLELAKQLRKRADQAWERGNKELSEELHELARKYENGA